MNLRLIIIVVAWFLLPANGSGQTLFKVNQYNILYDGSVMPIMTLFTNHSISPKFSATTYFYVNAYPGGSWGEGLAGVTYTPWKGIHIGFLGGFQSNETEIWRASPIVLMHREKFRFFGSFEFGGRRDRWDVMAFYVARPFLVGAELIRYYRMYAAGPRVEFTFLKSQPITLFHSSLWDWVNGKYAAMFGIYTTFSSLKIE